MRTGPQLKKDAGLVLCDRVLAALWKLLKKRGRTKQLLYGAAVFTDHTGYLVIHRPTLSSGHPCVLVFTDGAASNVHLIAGSLHDFGHPGGAPVQRVFDSPRHHIVVKAKDQTSSGRTRRDSKAAEMMLMGLTYGNFDPDLIERIGGLNK